MSLWFYPSSWWNPKILVVYRVLKYIFILTSSIRQYFSGLARRYNTWCFFLPSSHHKFNTPVTLPYRQTKTNIKICVTCINISCSLTLLFKVCIGIDIDTVLSDKCRWLENNFLLICGDKRNRLFNICHLRVWKEAIMEWLWGFGWN